jgi:RNA polymerase sigma factor (sigma-70 family)
LMNHVDDLDADKNLKYYILQIAKNLAYDYLRKTRPEVGVENIEELVAHDRPMPEDERFNHLMSRYREFVNADEYDILILHLYFGLKFSEIATLKNKTLRSIEGSYERAVAKLKKRARKEDFNE